MKLFKKCIEFLLICGVFFLLFGIFFHEIGALTQDLGRHLLLGKIIVETRHVPTVNLLSYVYPNFPFINTHWLSEVIFYLVQMATGFTGLLIFTTCLMLFAFGILFFAASKKFGILISIFVMLLSIPIMFERTDLRPEFFSYLFVAIFMVILYRYKQSFTPLLYLLIPIEALWVNMHIYFLIGELVIWIFLLDSLWQSRDRLFPLSKHLTALFIVAILVSLSTLMNPNGIQGALYPFFVFNNYGFAIAENVPVAIFSLSHTISITFLQLEMVLFYGFLLYGWKKVKLLDSMLGIVFGYIAASAIRNIVLFPLVMFIPLCRELSLAVHDKPIFVKNRSKVFVLIFFVLFFFASWEMYTFLPATGGINSNQLALGKGTADFFLTNHLEGPIFNDFETGSYLDYRLSPIEKVFVDGRPEAYPATFFSSIYDPMQLDKNIFAKEDKQYHFISIIYSDHDLGYQAVVFIHNISSNPNWKLVYLDSYAAVWVRNTKANRAIIDRYGMDREHVKISFFNPSNITDLYYLALFFDKAGWINQEIAMYQDIFSLDPNYCPALANSLFLLRRENVLADSMQVYQYRYQSYCQ